MDDLKLEAIIYVPFNFTEMFRCIVCKGYLSVPPIVSGNNGRSVCGRCDFLTHNKLERRNTIYEGMARIMDFPCNFNKCPSRIHWGEVEHHEKVCLYREIPCPKNDCNRVVLLRELVLHFYDCHDFRKASTVTVEDLDMNQPNFESPRLLMCGEKPYLVFCYGNETSLNVGVFALDPRGNDDVDYAVELASQSGAFTKGKQRILPFNDRLHCTACFRATCTKIHHKYSKLYKDNTVDELHATLPTKFEIEPLKKLLETEKVKLTVTLKSEIDAGGPAKKRKLELPPVSDCETCKVLVILPETCKKLGITLAEGIRRHVKQCPCNADINEILADEFDAGDIMEDVWALPDVGLRDVAVQTDVGEKQKESEDNCVPGAADSSVGP